MCYSLACITTSTNFFTTADDIDIFVFSHLLPDARAKGEKHYRSFHSCTVGTSGAPEEGIKMKASKI
jgi:hypothetical protein